MSRQSPIALNLAKAIEEAQASANLADQAVADAQAIAAQKWERLEFLIGLRGELGVKPVRKRKSRVGDGATPALVADRATVPGSNIAGPPATNSEAGSARSADEWEGMDIPQGLRRSA